MRDSLPRCGLRHSKIRYPSERIVRTVRSKVSARIRIYRCGACGGYHLTKKVAPYTGRDESQGEPEEYGRISQRHRSRKRRKHVTSASAAAPDAPKRKPGEYYVDYLGSKAGVPRLFRAGNGKTTVDALVPLDSSEALEAIAEALNSGKVEAPSESDSKVAAVKEKEKEKPKK